MAARAGRSIISWRRLGRARGWKQERDEAKRGGVVLGGGEGRSGGRQQGVEWYKQEVSFGGRQGEAEAARAEGTSN